MDAMEQTINRNRSFAGVVRLILFLFFNEYLYTVLHTFHNTRAKVFFNAKDTLLHFKLSAVFYAGSLILFGLFLSLKSIGAQKLNRLAGTVTLFAVPLILLMFHCQNPRGYLSAYYLLMPLCAFECVYAYTLLSAASAGKSHIGVIFFAGMSFATLLQYFLQTVLARENLILYSLIVISFALAYLEFTETADVLWEVTAAQPPTAQMSRFVPIFVSSVIILILLEAIGNFLTFSLLSSVYEGNYLPLSSSRLFFLLSFLMMGLAAEIKDMKFLPVLTLTGVLVGILNPLLFQEGSKDFLNACIYYVMAGAINSFYILSMWKLARGNRFAPVIAVSGCFIDKFFSSLFISPVISGLSLIGSISLELVIIIVIIILFVFSGEINFGSGKGDDMEYTERMAPEEFAAFYGLSRKETEILIRALNYKGNMSDLAKELFISRSALYRYLRNISIKTGQDSFREVKDLYYRMPVSLEKAADSEAHSPDFSRLPEQSNLPADRSMASSGNSDSETADSIKTFAEIYRLNENEYTALRLFLDNPGITQKELADLENVTLRTMQRRFSSIRQKTGVSSLSEVSRLYHEMFLSKKQD